MTDPAPWFRRGLRVARTSAGVRAPPVLYAIFSLTWVVISDHLVAQWYPGLAQVELYSKIKGRAVSMSWSARAASCTPSATFTRKTSRVRTSSS